LQPGSPELLKPSVRDAINVPTAYIIYIASLTASIQLLKTP